MPPFGPQHECHLLTGPVALAAQGLLALLAVVSLLLKRWCTSLRTMWVVWSTLPCLCELLAIST